MPCILALDQSTSATKALLFDAAGSLRDKVSRDHAQHYPQPGWVEHDANEIWRNTLGVMADLVARNPGEAQDLLCLGITNQRETVVVFDRATGEPLHNAIVWQCRRGEPMCTRLTAGGHGARVQEITGLKIDTYFPASKIRWLMDNHPEIAAKLRSGEALVGTIDAYLVYRLTGGQVFATDHTNASRTLLYDIRSLSWSDELCELFGVPMRALPEPREPGAQYGVADLGGLLGHRIPICGVMGDSQAALFAQRCFHPGSAKVTLGTGSSVLLNIGEQLRHSPNGIVTTIGWVYNGRVTYAFEGIINYAGATVAWLRDQLRLIADVRETEALAMSVEDNGGVYLVPAFVGLSAPYWRPGVRAAIVGLSPSSTKEHVVRAALEAVAYRIDDVLGLMVSDSGVPLQVLHADGGMVSNRFLMQFMADMLRYQVRASSLPELSALGATLSGALGMGLYNSLDELAALEASTIAFTPSMPEERASAFREGWKRAIGQALTG